MIEPPEGNASAIYRFRDMLLRKTVDWCREHSKFYREHLALSATFGGLRELALLPVLRRDDVLRYHAELICSNEIPACVQYTTGTTGRFLPLFRSRSEISFLNEFYNLTTSQKIGSQDKQRPLQLALTSAYHGSPTPIPSPAFILTAGVYDRTQAQQATNLLQTHFAFPGVEERISTVLGGDILLKALTAYLVDEGVDPASTDVRTLVFTGGYTSLRTKRLLAKLWNASVIDRYSMSEVFGGAVQVAPSAPFLFDVEVIPEVVDPFTLSPVRRGYGVLLLTSLYPFSQMMPMIRYYTGDLVEIVGGTEQEADFAVRFLGRERRSIIEEKKDGMNPLVFAADLYDTLEALPDVAGSPRFKGLCSDAAMEFSGKLHYGLDDERDENGVVRAIRIRVGLRYAPWQHPEHVDQLATRIRIAIYERSPILRARVLDGGLSLSIEFTTADKVAPFTMK